MNVVNLIFRSAFVLLLLIMWYFELRLIYLCVLVILSSPNLIVAFFMLFVEFALFCLMIFTIIVIINVIRE